jgi:hypothetical protein
MGPMGPPRGGRGGMMPPRGPPRGPPPVGYDAGPNQSFDSYGRSMAHPEESYESPIGMAVSSAEPQPIGQAIEMTSQPRRYEAHLSDHSEHSEPHALSVDGHYMPQESPTSLYSRGTESYVPARAGWGNEAPRPSPSPVHVTSGGNYYEDVDPRFARRPSPQGGGMVPSALTPGGL